MTNDLPMKSATVLPTVRIGVQGVRKNVDLDSEFWAINWFDRRFEKLYDFYNLLAWPMVKKAGARVLFKGKLLTRLEGTVQLEREALLIVTYPNVDNFLAMLSDLKFQMIGMLREIAVSKFVFGFMDRVGEHELPSSKARSYRGGNKYLVHHFKVRNKGSEQDFEKEVGLTGILDAAEVHGGIRSLFAGTTKARVGVVKAVDKFHAGRFFMEGMLVWEADKESELREFWKSEASLIFRQSLSMEYAGLFKRIL